MTEERPPIDRSAYPEEVRDNIQYCEGPCGRLTRSSRYRKYLAPDTVTRQVGGKCQTCNHTTDVTLLDPEAHAKAKEADNEAARRKLAATVETLSAYTLDRRRRIAARQAKMRGRQSA